MSGYLMGYDVGSSSIKASLLEVDGGTAVASASSPKDELQIQAPKPGWAEQDPDVWWRHLVEATVEIARSAEVDLRQVKAVGISYQMHGLVCLDGQGRVLRPSIIWCDSRAVEIGEKAFAELGPERCLKRLLNSPGNFTASKLRWVKENEPEIFARIDRILLPGDYIAFRLTGELTTTPSGLSEGILWDYGENAPALFLLEHFGIPERLIAPVVPNFAVQGGLSAEASGTLGMKPGTPVTYRGGDQPNNALSLNVLEPGEVAATAGTSGVVYGVGSEAAYDPRSRVNTFVHVNHSREAPRYGTLMCVNGAGILNSWLRRNLMRYGGSGATYEQMNEAAAGVPAGCDGLLFLPYGNGAERTLENKNIGASVHGLDFNRHGRPHLLRSAQEGIVFALRYGLEIMEEMGLEIETVRAGAANLFLSPLFARAFATVCGAAVELQNTDGSQGAARGAGIGAGIYSLESAFKGREIVRTVEPERSLEEPYRAAYGRWRSILKHTLESA
jgi:xylulokinase